MYIYIYSDDGPEKNDSINHDKWVYDHPLLRENKPCLDPWHMRNLNGSDSWQARMRLNPGWWKIIGGSQNSNNINDNMLLQWHSHWKTAPFGVQKSPDSFGAQTCCILLPCVRSQGDIHMFQSCRILLHRSHHHFPIALPKAAYRAKPHKVVLSSSYNLVYKP